MGPSLYNPFADGPTMVLSPPQGHSSFQFPSQPMFNATSQSLQTMDGVHPTSSQFMAGHSSSWKPTSSANAIFTNPSRKRSREQSSFADADNTSNDFTPVPKPAPAPLGQFVEEPIYGEGMVLLNPRTGMLVSAESQTGTWYEEHAEEHVVLAPPISSRSLQLHDANGSAAPGLRKSQRLDHSAPGLDDISLASIRQRLQRSSDDHSRSLNKNISSIIPEEPLVDDVTCLLGISWQRISHDDNMAPAVCGWEKYINNHFYRYLHSARILLKNRSMNAYLVAAQSTTQSTPVTNAFLHHNAAAPSSFDFGPATCFYLFKEDLTEARLVGTSWDICLQNLRSAPIRFEGAEILKAAERSPERIMGDQSVPVNCVVGNGIPIARVSKEDRVIIGENGDANDDMVMGTGMDLDF